MDFVRVQLCRSVFGFGFGFGCWRRGRGMVIWEGVLDFRIAYLRLKI